MKLARAAIQLEADPPDWLADALAAIEAGRAVRKEFEGGGRLHIDRALPFLCVHFTRSDEAPVAREVVRANASHLLAPALPRRNLSSPPSENCSSVDSAPSWCSKWTNSPRMSS